MTFLKRHKQFLKEVLIYTFTAFGGPQGHYGMLLKIFVNKRKDLTQEEFIEYNSFCQLLPGASSTQLISLIGYKRGGLKLAIFTLLIWILPACILMGLLSLLISNHVNQNLSFSLFKFIQPMAIGFLLFTSLKSFSSSVKNTITIIIMFTGMLVMFFFIKTPWVLPILIICAGIATNFSSKRIPKQTDVKPREMKWTNIFIFLFVFLLAGLLSESARKNDWNNRKLYNVFENFYRFGSFVFGGGDVLLPMMLDQYVERPGIVKIIQKNPGIIKIDKGELLTGYGLVKALPGPVFSIASYTGGLAVKEYGNKIQMLGSLVGTIAIFLPSALLVFFFFPVWQNLKKYVVVFRALEGINAVVVGVMFATTFYLLKYISLTFTDTISLINVFIILTTFILLNNTKISPTLIVFACIFFGWVF
jgi:chromate transporter